MDAEKSIGSEMAEANPSRSVISTDESVKPEVMPAVTPDPPSLRIYAEAEFLPAPQPLIVAGGVAGLMTLVATLVGCWLIPYNIRVKAPAVLRPQGELRQVQAPRTGLVQQIAVEVGQTVEQDDIIAVLEGEQLQTQTKQTRQELEALRQQLNGIQAERRLLEANLRATRQSWEREIRIAQANLRSNEQQQNQQQANAQGEIRAAIARVKLAEQELRRFRQGAEQGVIPQLRVLEQESELEAAKAELSQARASAQANTALVEQATEQIARTEADRDVSLAQLDQEQVQLEKQQAELESNIAQREAAIAQLSRERSQLVLRAPVSGQVQATNLRNLNQVVQSGELVAQIAPLDDALTIKAWVPNSGINQVEPGQRVQMRLDSCPYPDFGVLEGEVTVVLNDVTTAQPFPNGSSNGSPGGSQFSGNSSNPAESSPGSYEIQIRPQTQTLQSQGQRCQLQAGMSGRADILVGRETILRFLLRKARLVSDL